MDYSRVSPRTPTAAMVSTVTCPRHEDFWWFGRNPPIERVNVTESFCHQNSHCFSGAVSSLLWDSSALQAHIHNIVKDFIQECRPCMEQDFFWELQTKGLKSKNP